MEINKKIKKNKNYDARFYKMWISYDEYKTLSIGDVFFSDDFKDFLGIDSCSSNNDLDTH